MCDCLHGLMVMRVIAIRGMTRDNTGPCISVLTSSGDFRKNIGRFITSSTTMPLCLPFFRSSREVRDFQEDNAWTAPTEEKDSSSRFVEQQDLALGKEESRHRLEELRVLMQDNKIEY
jgi:hypothetical protein